MIETQSELFVQIEGFKEYKERIETELEDTKAKEEESERIAQEKAAIKLQSALRGYKDRKEYKTKKDAAIKLQRAFREKIGRNKLKKC